MRRIFPILAVTSLLLAILSVSLWVYSVRHIGVLRFCVGDQLVAPCVAQGVVVMTILDADSCLPRPPGKSRWPWFSIPYYSISNSLISSGGMIPATEHRFLGFGLSQTAEVQAAVSNRRRQVSAELAEMNRQLQSMPPSMQKSKIADHLSVLRMLATPENRRVFQFPLWFCLLLFSVIPGILFYRSFFRRRRFVQGLCPKCGYDLRASKERCPECGLAIGMGDFKS